MGEELSGSLTAINSSNIGFQLLKKQGWKEGTGLGVAEQGRLEPVQTYVKNNKRGLGAETLKKKTPKPVEALAAECKSDSKLRISEKLPPKKSKASKRMRKMQELERRLQETEFERAFRREFWPDNV